jgi:hypothetical protein
MKLRLHGTPAECAAATQCAAPPASTPKTRAARIPDRRGELVRVYLTVHLNPAPAPGQGSG